MKKGTSFFTVILLVICFGWWFNRYPSFTNESLADIEIYQGDSLLYDLVSVEKGAFVFNLKQDPRHMIFTYEGAEVRLNEQGTHYVVKIDYQDPEISDIEFL